MRAGEGRSGAVRQYRELLRRGGVGLFFVVRAYGGVSFLVRSEPVNEVGFLVDYQPFSELFQPEPAQGTEFIE